MFSRNKADTLGILSAVLCLIHCLLFPLLILTGFMSDHWADHSAWMDYFFVVLAVFAVVSATRSTTRNDIKFWMWLSATWFSVSVLLHDTYSVAIVSSALSSVALVAVHTINFRQHLQVHRTKRATI